MDTNKIRKLITAALMSALTCVATLSIHFPTPIGGYIHPGDVFVILSGIILGPLYGAGAAGIGSMLADFISGYPLYAPATLVIKALAAVVSAAVYRKNKMYIVILAGVLASIVVTSGYFIYDGFLYGISASFANAPLNLIQNVLGIVLSALLYPLLRRVYYIKDLMDRRN